MLNQLRRSLWSFFPFQPILTIPQKKGRLRRQSRNGIYRWNGSSTCLGSMRAGPLGKKRILNNLYVRLTYPGEKVIPIFRIKPNRRFIFWQGPSYWASLHKGASFCMSWLTYWQCNKIRGQKWNRNPLWALLFFPTLEIDFESRLIGRMTRRGLLKSPPLFGSSVQFLA